MHCQFNSESAMKSLCSTQNYRVDSVDTVDYKQLCGSCGLDCLSLVALWEVDKLYLEFKKRGQMNKQTEL